MMPFFPKTSPQPPRCLQIRLQKQTASIFPDVSNGGTPNPASDLWVHRHTESSTPSFKEVTPMMCQEG